MSSGGSGRNDVEFSIGADNAPLTDDLKESGAAIERFADEGVSDAERVGEAVDKIGESAEEAAEKTEDVAEGLKDSKPFAEDLADEFGEMGEQVAGLMDKWGGTVDVMFQAFEIGQQYFEMVLEAAREQSGLNDALNRQVELEKELLELNKERASGIVAGKDPAEIQEELNRLLNEQIKLEEKLTDRLNKEADLRREGEQIRDTLRVTNPFGGESARLQERLGEIEGGGLVGRLTGLGGTGRQGAAGDQARETREVLKQNADAIGRLEAALQKLAPPSVELESKQRTEDTKAIRQATEATATAIKSLKQGMTP